MLSGRRGHCPPSGMADPTGAHMNFCQTPMYPHYSTG